MSTNENFPRNAVRGLDGKPVILRDDDSAPYACELITEYLGYRVTFPNPASETSDTTMYLIPGDKHQRNPTTAERAAIEALVWCAQTYRRGMKRGEAVVFPRVVHSMSDDAVSEDERFTFCDEARAFMFAGVIESVFRADAQVIETPHGWLVSVTDRNIVEMCMIDIHQMEGVCMALCDYVITPSSDASTNSPGGQKKYYAPAAREAWYTRKNAQAQRIEDGINAILAHLGHPVAQDVAESIATGAELVESIEASARRSRPVKAAGRKSSAKRSA